MDRGQALREHHRARRAAVWLLRADGLTLDAIGARMGGLSRERVRQILYRYAREMRHALRKTGWSVIDGEGLRPVMSDVLDADRAAKAVYERLYRSWDWATTGERQHWRKFAAMAASEDPAERKEVEAQLVEIDNALRECSEADETNSDT